MTEHQEEEQLIDASEAVRYLAQKWEIPSYSMDAFKQLRLRRHIKPALASKTATFWRKSDLDLIPKPDRHKARGPRTNRVKKSVVAGDGVASDLPFRCSWSSGNPSSDDGEAA